MAEAVKSFPVRRAASQDLVFSHDLYSQSQLSKRQSSTSESQSMTLLEQLFLQFFFLIWDIPGISWKLITQVCLLLSWGPSSKGNHFGKNLLLFKLFSFCLFL